MKKLFEFLFLISCLVPVCVRGAASEEPRSKPHKKILAAVRKGEVPAVERHIKQAKDTGNLVRALRSADETGHTLLHLAANRGNAAVVKLLLDVARKSDDKDLLRQMLLAYNDGGLTPLYLAISKEHTAVVNLLLDAARKIRKGFRRTMLLTTYTQFLK